MKKVNLKKVAIIVLSCKDYESLEISLANYLENTSKEAHFFILQNGKGSYDKDRTWRVADRYRNLYPEQITLVDWLPEAKPYRVIKQLLHSKELEGFDYVCKVDDDTFPVTKDWLEKLMVSYLSNKEKYGKDLAFTFPLVNNNPWGFKRTVELLKLKEEYDRSIGRVHLAGSDFMPEHFPLKVFQKDEIFPSGFGTVWRYPYIARWIHEKTTMNVKEWVEALESQPDELFDNKIRYSINCMFFEKKYWDILDNGTDDDETSVHLLSMKHNHKLVACPSVPFVHLFFFSQREENKDLIPLVRSYYQKLLNISYPIGLNEDKEYELENRLRYLEDYLIWQTKYMVAICNKDRANRRRTIYKLLSNVTWGKLKKRLKEKAKKITKDLQILKDRK